MKKLIIILGLLIAFCAKAQYNPSLHTVSNKAYGLNAATATDARSYFYDQLTFSYRPYASRSEILSYLNLAKYRTGQFPIILDSSSRKWELWFRDGVTNSDLVYKLTDTAGIFAGYLKNTLLNGRIFVGNASNIAIGVLPSGDATISNTGVLTLANTGVMAGSYTNASVTVDAKGRLTNIVSGAGVPTWQQVLTAGPNLSTQNNASSLGVRTFTFNMVPGDFGNTSVVFGGNTTANAPNILIMGDAASGTPIPARITLGDASTNNDLQIVNDLNESYITLTGVGSGVAKLSLNPSDIRLVVTNAARLKEFRNIGSDSGLIVLDKYDTVGLSYAANYRGIAIAKKGNRWIPDKGYVDSLFATGGGGGSGTVTSVGTGYGLSGGTITTSGTLLVDSLTLSGYYLRRKDSTLYQTKYGVDTMRLNIYTALSGKQPTGNYITALTGDGSATGPGSAAFTLATVNSNVGSFTNANITVNAKGLITAASNGSGGGGTNNANIGSGFRWINDPSTQTIRTVVSSNTIIWDSTSNANSLTANGDTSVLATQFDIRQIRDSSFITGTNGQANRILFSKTYFPTTGDFTVTGVTTSIVDNAIRMIGGDATFNRYLTLNGSIETDENLRIAATFKISAAVAAGHFGIAVGRHSINTWYAPSIVVQYSPIDKLIKIVQTDNTTVLSVKTLSYTPALNDIVKVTYYQEGNVVTGIFENTTQAQTDYLTVVGNLGATKNLAIPNSSQPIIHEMGGSNDVINYEVSSGTRRNPTIICLTDSKGLYSVNDITTAWTSRVADTLGATNRFSGDGDRTVEMTQTILNSISYGGKYALLCIGRNDLASAVPTLTWQANYISIRDTLVAAGFTVIHILPIPETNVPDQSALKNFIIAQFPSDLQIDPSVGWNMGTMLSADGVHPNQFGHRFIANLIVRSGYIPIQSNIPKFIGKNYPFGNFITGLGTVGTYPIFDGSGHLANSTIDVASGYNRTSLPFNINVTTGDEKIALTGSNGPTIRAYNGIGVTLGFIQWSSGFAQFATPAGTIPIDLRPAGASALRANVDGSVEIGNAGFGITSAVLNIPVTDRGILIPRLTTTQQAAIAAPTSWLYIHNIDSAALTQRNPVTIAWEAYATRNWVRGQSFATGNTLYTGDGTATNRTVTLSGFLNFIGGEVKIGSATDQGSFTLQNTGGFYQSGSVSINGIPLAGTGYKLLVQGTDSTLRQIALTDLPVLDTIRYRNGLTVRSGTSVDTVLLGGALTEATTLTFGTNNLIFDASSSGDIQFTLGSDATGDVFYRNSGGAVTRLGIGSTNQVLTVSGGLPSWQNAASGGVTSIGTINSQTKSANGAVITGTSLVMQTADNTTPGLVSTTTQGFNGQKTFLDGSIFQSVSTSGTSFVPRITMNGNLSGSGEPGVFGLGIDMDVYTYTDGGSARTVSNLQSMNRIWSPTIASTNAVTYNDIFNLRVDEPIAGTNMTFVRPRSLYATGRGHVDILMNAISEGSGTPATMNSIGHWIWTGTTGTWTLPSLAAYKGAIYFIKNAGSGNLTIQAGGSDNIYDTGSVTSIIIAAGTARVIVAGLSFWYVE